MENKKLNKKDIMSLIQEEAYILVKKTELLKQLKDFKKLNECTGLTGRGMVGSHGFANNSNVTGFKETPKISHFDQLVDDLGLDKSELESGDEGSTKLGFGDEFAPNEDVSVLKQENERLKQELAQLKAGQLNETKNKK
jgi:hypothetical protein